jgi:hypothetical protein
LTFNFVFNTLGTTNTEFLPRRLLRFQEISRSVGSILVKFRVFILGERREHVTQKGNMFARGSPFIPYCFLHPAERRIATQRDGVVGQGEIARFGFRPLGMGEIGFSERDPNLSRVFSTLVPRRERQGSNGTVRHAKWSFS